MKYLLDTNAWIKILNPQPSDVKKRLAALDPSIVATCSVVKAELYFSAYKSAQKTANLLLLEELFSQFECLNFTDEAAKICGNTRNQLAKLGKPIGPYDYKPDIANSMLL